VTESITLTMWPKSILQTQSNLVKHRSCKRIGIHFVGKIQEGQKLSLSAPTEGTKHNDDKLGAAPW